MAIKTLVVNLYGGPGTGKSTMTAALFAELKWRGFNAEMALEYAKRKVWEKSAHVLDDQVYVFGKQYHTQRALDGQVDVIITDSPLLMSIVYNSAFGEDLNKLVLQQYEEFENVNIFLNRVKPYNPSGRVQTENEAKELDTVCSDLLDKLGFPYTTYDGCKESVEKIADYVIYKFDSLNGR